MHAALALLAGPTPDLLVSGAERADLPRGRAVGFRDRGLGPGSRPAWRIG